MQLVPSPFHISLPWPGKKNRPLSDYGPWLLGTCHLAVTWQSRRFQVKLSAIKVAFCVCLCACPPHFLHPERWPADCLCLVYFLGDLLSEWESSRGLSWDEAWLYQTTITLHLHSICTLLFSSRREGACVALCLCTLCYHVLLWAYVRATERKWMWAKKKKKDERGEGGARRVHMIQPLHLMQVPFAPYCLSHCWKKAGDLPSLKRQLIPFPLAWCFVCVCLCLCVCLQVCTCVQYIHSDNRSICLCAMTHLWVWIVAVSP